MDGPNLLQPFLLLAVNFLQTNRGFLGQGPTFELLKFSEILLFTFKTFPKFLFQDHFTLGVIAVCLLEGLIEQIYKNQMQLLLNRFGESLLYTPRSYIINYKSIVGGGGYSLLQGSIQLLFKWGRDYCIQQGSIQLFYKYIV